VFAGASTRLLWRSNDCARRAWLGQAIVGVELLAEGRAIEPGGPGDGRQRRPGRARVRRTRPAGRSPASSCSPSSGGAIAGVELAAPSSSRGAWPVCCWSPAAT